MVCVIKETINTGRRGEAAAAIRAGFDPGGPWSGHRKEWNSLSTYYVRGSLSKATLSEVNPGRRASDSPAPPPPRGRSGARRTSRPPPRGVGGRPPAPTPTPPPLERPALGARALAPSPGGGGGGGLGSAPPGAGRQSPPGSPAPPRRGRRPGRAPGGPGAEPARPARRREAAARYKSRRSGRGAGERSVARPVGPDWRAREARGVRNRARPAVRGALRFSGAAAPPPAHVPERAGALGWGRRTAPASRAHGPGGVPPPPSPPAVAAADPEGRGKTSPVGGFGQPVRSLLCVAESCSRDAGWRARDRSEGRVAGSGRSHCALARVRLATLRPAARPRALFLLGPPPPPAASGSRTPGSRWAPRVALAREATGWPETFWNGPGGTHVLWRKAPSAPEVVSRRLSALRDRRRRSPSVQHGGRPGAPPAAGFEVLSLAPRSQRCPQRSGEGCRARPGAGDPRLCVPRRGATMDSSQPLPPLRVCGPGSREARRWATCPLLSWPLQVKDVVGYNSLGHCFFTEDGPEERNTFDHCLGLLVKSGTLLPSDRDSKMCRMITEDSYPGYVPKPRQDCNAVSTFWMANPNNNLINCAAAGSEETGFWFIFHHVPTGPSVGTYSPGYSEHIPLGRFHNNRAHSNYRAGMIIDNGVKTTEASAKDKRPFLSIISARYSPHQDADPLKPREPAIIKHFTAYKNQDHGAWLRGGDVWLDSCRFADNGIGLTLASGGTFPYDDGSKQEIKNSLFVGESGNVGTEMMDNRIWGPGGLDHSGRTLPIGQNFPIRGIQFYDGPINIQNCTFRKFVALEGRHTSALAFRLNNAWQSCPHNNVTNIAFEDVPITSRVFFGEPGPWFNQLDMDGDKTSVFHDVDGSVSEYPGSYLTKDDNWLVRHPDCINVPDWRGAICSGRYAQMYIQAYKTSNLRMKIIKNDFPSRPLHLEGALARSTHYQQYQPVVALQKGYTVHWDQPAPAELAIWLINFNKGDWIRVGFCYPRGTSFSILSDVHNRLLKQTSKTGTFVRTLQMDKVEQSFTGRGHYYWDEDSGLLFLKLRAQNERERFAFCSVRGCERIRIKALIPKNAGVSDCTATAYPRFAERAVVDVPMPRKLRGAQLKTKDRFLEVKMESSRQRFFHLLSDVAYIEVDGTRYPSSEDGIQMVAIDGSRGHVVSHTSFSSTMLQGVPWQLFSHVAAIPDNSIVLVVSKGRYTSRGLWTRVLEKLGADKSLRLKEKMAFVGFKGSFRPTWVTLDTEDHGAKIFQVVPIPVVRKKKL
ncbi:cell migration-inducing and hyaluronan-binding protein [Lynx canadensis]|uniref:cell migration-inducing and hyaluronan-binding protein n=1 Tax=Lynx canadensis TaxID=61383 RepID=UPI0011B05BC6|nr:cell migration-inducing and hyaluronan-binding protein [Lynx canadensis]